MARYRFRRKVAVAFTHPTATRAQILNRVENDYVPALRNKWGEKLAANFTDIEYWYDIDLAQSHSDVHAWALYPKIVIWGDSALTSAEVKTLIYNAIPDIKTAFENRLINDGCTILFWKAHRDRP